jgi:cobalamin biosynthesis protein CobT
MGRRIERDADLGLALVIDRSGSMSGDRIELAKTIALLLAESASGVPGVEGTLPRSPTAATTSSRISDGLAGSGRSAG